MGVSWWLAIIHRNGKTAVVWSAFSGRKRSAQSGASLLFAQTPPGRDIRFCCWTLGYVVAAEGLLNDVFLKEAEREDFLWELPQWNVAEIDDRNEGLEGQSEYFATAPRAVTSAPLEGGVPLGRFGRPQRLSGKDGDRGVFGENFEVLQAQKRLCLRIDEVQDLQKRKSIENLISLKCEV